MLLWAQAQVQLKQASAASDRLQTWVALRSRDAAAWQALANAYGAQGRALSAIRCEAEARAAQLDYAAAIDRLKAAQDLVRSGAAADYIEASIIDARARQIASLLREQSLER